MYGIVVVGVSPAGNPSRNFREETFETQEEAEEWHEELLAASSTKALIQMAEIVGGSITLEVVEIGEDGKEMEK